MHTATYEFFDLVSSRLKSSGRAVINIVANPMLNDAYSRNMDSTVRQALSGCITDITGYEDLLVNIVYFCSKRQTGQSQPVAALYRDENTKVVVDGHISAVENHKKLAARAGRQ